ncbi:MAG: histone deacetylase [Spirochaetaceae bacterium]|jgi:acetoin utilization deacetylase AcuC-like enzyme|nr:histone deacetylase [Spirochaetaceae bacterium]
MILYDPALLANFLDYGIMLPIPPERGKQVLEFLGSGLPGPVLNAAAALALLGQEGPAITRADLERIHSRDYIAGLYGEGLTAAILKSYELIDSQGRTNRYEPERAVKPLTELFQGIIAQAGGTCLACALALEDASGGFCYYLGGGMHHARYDSGSGFCLINDVAAAAFKTLLSHKPVRMIWIIDLDAHKGDGTAELVRFAQDRGELRLSGEKSAHDKPCILTLSIHMAKGWPLDKESLLAAEAGRAPLLPSDVDIGIDAGEEGEYTPRLAEGMRELERLSGETMQPDFALVVDGADPYEHDGLPSSSPLRLTLEQCLERDTYVYRYLTDRGIPSAWIQAGGYGSRAWEPPAHFLQSIGTLSGTIGFPRQGCP